MLRPHTLQPGSSLALAVLNSTLPWPRSQEWAYPAALHQIVADCLVQDPKARPTAAQLHYHVQGLRQAGLPDPPALQQAASPNHVTLQLG